MKSKKGYAGQSLLVLMLLLCSSHLVSSQSLYRSLDLGFPAPGDINFQLDHYIEEYSYSAELMNSTYFKNWKRFPAPLNITDIVNITTVGDLSPSQAFDLNFLQAFRDEQHFTYRLYLQPKGETRLFEFQCELHSKVKELGCSGLKYFPKREGVKAIVRTSTFNALLRQDKLKGKDVIEISQGLLDNLYTVIEISEGSITPQQLIFKEIDGVSTLFIVKTDGSAIDIYQFQNDLAVSPKTYQPFVPRTAEITAAHLNVGKIEEVFMDEFIPNFPVVRSGTVFSLYNATANFISGWNILGAFTPRFNQYSFEEGLGALRVYVSYPRVIILSAKTSQILEYDVSNPSNITLRREYINFGYTFPQNAIYSDFSYGQNLLYVLCQPNYTTNYSYIVVYDVERNFKESALDYDYKLLAAESNIRKAIRVDITSLSTFALTVAPVDALSDLVFYIKNGRIQSHRLYRHYQVTGSVTKDQYCKSLQDMDCFYLAFVSLNSEIPLKKKEDAKFIEEIYIDISFTQVPPEQSKKFTHSTLIEHKTELNTFEIFDGSVMNLTLKQPKGANLTIKKPLELLKTIPYKIPSGDAVLDFTTNLADVIYMSIGTYLYKFKFSIANNSMELAAKHPIAPNCRHIFTPPYSEDVLLVCHHGDHIYNISDYFITQDESLGLIWSRIINTRSFKGKMTPDGAYFYILYDVSDNNPYFLEIHKIGSKNSMRPNFVKFPETDFYRKIYNTPLTNNTFIQAFDLAIDSTGKNYLMVAITNDNRIIMCKTQIENTTISICRSRLAFVFEPRTEQKPEIPIYNELKILNDTHFIVNTLNSYTMYFSLLSWVQEDGDLSFLSADAEMGYAYYSDYPKYPQIALDNHSNLFLIANNGSSEDPLDCVIFMYSDNGRWSIEERGYVEPPLTTLSRSCPLPTYSPKLLWINGSLILIDDEKMSIYSTRSNFELELQDVGMFEPKMIELPLVASNDYSSVEVTWYVYGNLLKRPINYVIWITDAAAWFLVIVFFLFRSRGVGRQLSASLNKYLLKGSRKASDFAWEMSLPVFTSLFIFFFGTTTQGSARNGFMVFFMVLAFNGFLRSLAVTIVQEKSQKLKEYLKVCGMKMSTYILSFLILGLLKGLAIAFIQLLLIWVVCGLDNIFWILLGLVPTIASMIFRTLALTSFFERHRFASDWIGTTFGALSLLVFVPRYRNGYQSTAWLYSVFLPEIGYALGVSTSGLRDTLNYEYSILDTIKLNTFGSLMYLLAFLYLDQIIPNENGIRKSALFCLPRWPRNLLAKFTKKVSDMGVPMIQLQEVRAEYYNEDEAIDASSARFHEKLPDDHGLTRSIVADTIRKTFSDTVAINNVSFVAYEKQILCLLGHKGSGKSTLINLLAGMYNPDFGDIRCNFISKYLKHNTYINAIVDGLLDFKEFFSDIRSKIGYCASNDVLYSYLTVQETLLLIGRTKGVPKERLNLEMNDFYDKLGLLELRETKVKLLTKSQKRRLSVALALLGNRKYILLDEPTADLDAKSKHKIWELLREYKNEGKTIIITTKDTADVEAVADRVGVLSNGQLFALGSVEYVKDKIEVGYKLSITPSSDKVTTDEFSKVKTTVEQIVRKAIPLAIKEETSPARVLQFRLSFKDSHKFAEAFEELENIPQIKILMELTQFKDAFTNLTFTEEKYTNSDSYSAWLEESFGLPSEEQTVPIPTDIIEAPRASFVSQVLAMVLRKLYYAIKCPPAIAMYVLAVIYIITSCFFAFRRMKEKVEDEPWLELNIIGFWNIVFWAILLPSFAALPTTEREDRFKIRDTLRMHGLGTFAYWLGTLMIDMCIAAVFLSLELTVINITSIAFPFINQYTMKFSSVTYAYALCSITWGYVVGFFYSRGSSTYRFLGLFYFFVVFLLGFVIFNNLWDNGNGDNWFFWALKCVYFQTFPVGAYAESLIMLHVKEVSGYSKDLLQNQFYGAILYSDFWQYLIQLIANFFVYLIVAVCLDELAFNFLEKPEDIEPADNTTIIQLDPKEIDKEQKRANDLNNQDPILVRGLSKLVPEGPELLKGLSFGVQKGLIMGLLGPNRAGKSLLINIVTGMARRSEGDVRLLGQEQEDLTTEELVDLGIHTDYNPIWEHLSVKEHMKIHCLLKDKGWSGSANSAADIIIQRLGLSEFSDRKLKFLSPQAKKKLSLAMALVGTPRVLVLDDGVSTLDISSRKFVKEFLKLLVEKRKTTVLMAMRSMAEAEAFCDKIAVLVNGRICSLGYTPQMKERFAKAFKLSIIKIQETDPSLEEKIASIFPTAALVPSTDKREEVYELPVEKLILQKTFAELSKLQEEGLFQDFYFCNATLSEMFLYISQFQE